MTKTNSPSVRQRLRARLTSGPMIVAPGIYDAYGARFVEQAGFEAVYMTGNGVSASLLGRPDVGLDRSHADREPRASRRRLRRHPADLRRRHRLRQRGQRAAHRGGIRERRRGRDSPRRPGGAQALRPSAGLASGGVDGGACRQDRGGRARRAAIPISSSSRAPMPLRATGSTRRYAAAKPTAKPAPTWCSSN